jgi:hypothetical protein
MLADVRDGALRWVARRRGLVVPSLVADVRVEVSAEDEVAVSHAADAVAEADEADTSEPLASANGARPDGERPPGDTGPGSGSSPVEVNR